MTVTSEQSVTEVDSDRMREECETASYAAARLLEIAAGNADALVEGAHEEADQIVARARARAEDLNARAEEKRIEQDRAHRAALHELEQRRVVLEAEVNQLAEFARQHRNDLISYLTGQLETLHRPTIADATADADPLAGT